MAGRHPPRLTRHDEPYTARQGRRFAFPVGGVGAACAFAAAWRGHPLSAALVGAAALALLCAGVVVPARLRRVEAAWLSLAHAMARVTTPVLLTALWLLAFVPTAILLRVVGRRPLRRADNTASFWQDRDASQRRSDPTRLF